jgi:hypothetical protein
MYVCMYICIYNKKHYAILRPHFMLWKGEKECLAAVGCLTTAVAFELLAGPGQSQATGWTRNPTKPCCPPALCEEAGDQLEEFAGG